MKKTKNPSQTALDREERELLASFENDEWKTVKNFKKVKARARKTATKTLRKDVRTAAILI
jgi:predicted DNA binding CopG/RHH family protein